MSAASAFPDQDPYSAPAYNPAPPPKTYNPAPKAYAPRPNYKEEVDYPPQPYQFQYGVSAQEQGTNFKAVENQDAAGNVNGKAINAPLETFLLGMFFFFFQGGYEVQLPDGRLQTVKYIADGKNGFIAEVSYSGEPVYPPPPPGGYPGENGKRYEAPKYQPARPVYKPAPPVYEN